MTDEFKKEIVNFVEKELNEHKFESVYIDELNFLVLENINEKEQYISEEDKALVFIKNFFIDSYEAFKYTKEKFNIEINPFSESDFFTYFMIVFGVNELFENKKIIIYDNLNQFSDYTNNKIALTDNIINTIIDIIKD